MTDFEKETMEEKNKQTSNDFYRSSGVYSKNFMLIADCFWNNKKQKQGQHEDRLVRLKEIEIGHRNLDAMLIEK